MLKWMVLFVIMMNFYNCIGWYYFVFFVLWFEVLLLFRDFFVFLVDGWWVVWLVMWFVGLWNLWIFLLIILSIFGGGVLLVCEIDFVLFFCFWCDKGGCVIELILVLFLLDFWCFFIGEMIVGDFISFVICGVFLSLVIVILLLFVVVMMLFGGLDLLF